MLASKDRSDGKSQAFLTTSLSVGYSIPALPVAFVFGSLGVLQGIYAKHFGLALTTIASVVMVSRIFDAITDPMIGYCTDRCYERGISRKPFIITGGLLFIVASWFLYVPFGLDTTEGNQIVSTWYFLGWFLAYYLAHTLFEVPHLAWSNDLVTQPNEKNKIYTMRAFCTSLGSQLFYILPLLPLFPTNEITPVTFKWSILIAGVIMIITLLISTQYVPKSSLTLDSPTVTKGRQKTTPRGGIGMIIKNKPFLVLLLACAFMFLGFGMWNSLLFLFVDVYLGLGDKFAQLYLISATLTLVSLKLWNYIINRWGKQRSWCSGMLLMAAGILCFTQLSPEKTGQLSLLFCMALTILGFTVYFVAGPSLLSDIVDYGILKFGVDRSATYFSIYGLIFKTVTTFGAAVGLFVAGWYGFDATAIQHNESAVAGLRLSIAWLPSFFILTSIFFISRIPIRRRQYGIIRRFIDSRKKL